MSNTDEDSTPSDGMSDTWIKMSDSDYARVIFYDVPDVYSTGEDAVCYFDLTSLVTPDGDDYIGLYRIGWRHETECVASRKITDAIKILKDEQQMMSSIFKADTLPTDCEFYQFCYLTTKGEIRGASTPFRFQSPSQSSNDECVALEEDGDDFLVVHSQNALLKMKLEQYERHNQKLRQHNKELEDRIDKMVNSHLPKMGHCNGEEIPKLLCTSIFRQEECQKYENEVALLKEEGQEYKNHVAKYRKEVTLLENVLKMLEDTNRELKSEVKSLTAGKEYLAEKLEIMTQERDSLQSYVKDLQEKLQASRSRTDMLELTEEDTKTLIFHAKHLESDLQKKEADNLKLSNLLQEKEEERLFLQMRLDDTKAMLHAQEDTKSLMLEELGAHKEFRTEITAVLESVKSENFALKQKLFRLDDKKKRAGYVLENLKSEYTLLKHKIHLLEEKKKQRKDSATGTSSLEECGVLLVSVTEMENQKQREADLYKRIDELELRLLAGAKEYETQYLYISKLKKHIKKLEKDRKGSSSSSSGSSATAPLYSCKTAEGCGLQNNFVHNFHIKGTHRSNDSDTGECVAHCLHALSPSSQDTLAVKSFGERASNKLSNKENNLNKAQETQKLNDIQLEQLINENISSISRKSPGLQVNITNVKSVHTPCPLKLKMEKSTSQEPEKNVLLPLSSTPNAPLSECKIPVKSSDLLSHSNAVEWILPTPLTPEVSHLSESRSNEDFIPPQQLVSPHCQPNEELVKVVLSMENSMPSVFEIPCPICEVKLPVVADDNTFLIAHLKELHGQEPCPMCGQLFDTSLPDEYLHFHVEDHFHGENVPVIQTPELCGSVL